MADELGFSGKVAIVTGAGAAGDGIGNGRAAAILLARAGAKVLVVDRQQGLAENTVEGRGFRLGAVALTLAALLVSRPPTLESVLRRGAAVLIVFTSLSVFYSPQWVLWLTPLLLPPAPRQRGLALLIVALDVATLYTFPLGPLEGWLDTLVVARFAVLGAIAVLLLAGDRGAPQPDCCFAPPTAF